MRPAYSRENHLVGLVITCCASSIPAPPTLPSCGRRLSPYSSRHSLPPPPPPPNSPHFPARLRCCATRLVRKRASDDDQDGDGSERHGGLLLPRTRDRLGVSGREGSSLLLIVTFNAYKDWIAKENFCSRPPSSSGTFPYILVRQGKMSVTLIPSPRALGQLDPARRGFANWAPNFHPTGHGYLRKGFHCGIAGSGKERPASSARIWCFFSDTDQDATTCRRRQSAAGSREPGAGSRPATCLPHRSTGTASYLATYLKPSKLKLRREARVILRRAGLAGMNIHNVILAEGSINCLHSTSSIPSQQAGGISLRVYCRKRA